MIPSPSAVSSGSTAIAWDPEQRVAHVRYTRAASLNAADGDFLVGALTAWVGSDGQPFGILADAAGLAGTDSPYRAKASGFFRLHREHAFIALINVGPLIQIVVELFGLGTGIPLKTFAGEPAARAWLRSKGLSA